MALQEFMLCDGLQMASRPRLIHAEYHPKQNLQPYFGRNMSEEELQRGRGKTSQLNKIG